MKNIMKSLWYQVSKNRLYQVLSLIILVAPTIYIMNDKDFDKMTGAMAVASLSNIVPMLFYYYVCVVAPKICWCDLKDHFLHYEVLWGHPRKLVFWSRVLVTFEAMFPVLLFSIVPAISIPCMRNGFGRNMTIKEFLILYGMLFCIVVRFVMEVILLTLLLGDATVGIVFSAILEEVLALPAFFISFMNELKDEIYTGGGYYSALYRLMNVLDFGNHRTGFAEGEDIVQFVITPDPFKWAMDSVGMLVIAAIIILVAYRIFRKKDI